MLTATNIVKRFGQETALDQVSLSVKNGEIFAVIGPNGSGKSTLLAVVAGLLHPDAGEVSYRGKPLGQDQAALREIGFVPQQDGLFHDLTVRDNLAFWAAAAKVPLAKALAQPALLELGIPTMLRKQVQHLSGGMRRRVAIAVALIQQPALLILDEPFAGLDLYHKNQLTQQLLAMRESGVTILYTSHNADEIISLSDALTLLIDGRTVLSTPVSKLPSDQMEFSEYLLNLIRGEYASYEL